jgi:hypothetical protein
MIEDCIKKLQFLCTTIPVQLKKIDDEEFSRKPLPDKWSKKEILGHLIDSATNNHQRFVRVQFENVPTITYDQVNWNIFSNHNQFDVKYLISFWTAYNRHLAEFIRLIPTDNLERECIISQGKKVTLEWLIDDYLRHLDHHLKQIVEYE